MPETEATIEVAAPIIDMEVEAGVVVEKENGGAKREREDEAGENGDSKKAKAEKSFEEDRLVKSEDAEKKDDEEDEKKQVKLGPVLFNSSVEMFDYFNKLLRMWNPEYDINKYEHMVLMDLLKKGHHEPERKLGTGIEAFEIRVHPVWKSRCFFVRRVDGSSDDFSFRKCVNSILPLPKEMMFNNPTGGGGRRGGGGRGGRGGGWRGRGRRN